MTKKKQIANIKVKDFVWTNQPEVKKQALKPKGSIVPLSDDLSMFFKDSQYIQDMVAGPKTINKRR